MIPVINSAHSIAGFKAMPRASLRIVPRVFLSKLPPRDRTIDKFHFPLATHTVEQIYGSLPELLKDGLKKVTLNGHLHRKPRIRANKSFAQLRDENGDLIQLYFTPEATDSKFYDILKSSTTEESVSVTGHIQLKQQKQDEAENAELVGELVVENYQVLNESNLDAARLDKLKHSSPQDLPPQFRYLQLRTPFYQNALRTRSKVAQLMRNIFINNHDFVEIETPLLFKSTPEGAREFLVPTRAPDRFYALPQSPQQYKQILMCSGFTRYFQIARCFRDEDLRSDRQPEFTQIDMEMSYINSSDQVGTVVEDLIHNVWNKIGNRPTYKVNEDGYLQKIDFLGSSSTQLQFSKLKYKDALTDFGIDKPDLRSNIKFTDLSQFFSPVKNAENFPIVEVCKLEGAFNPEQPYKLNSALTDSLNYTKRKPIVLAIKKEEDAKNWYKKFVEKNVFTKTDSFDEQALQSLLNLHPGDIIAFSTRGELPYENPTPLGKFRQLAIEEFPDKWKRPIFDPETNELTTDYNTKDMCVGSWVVDFPLFNPIEISDEQATEFPVYDYTKFESTHHPFTMAKLEDYDLLATEPLKVRGEHYDLVINGVEVGGGSRRIHDAALQQFIFENILQIKNYNEIFGHLLHALSMGCPPHAGLALGFDRLCAMLIGSSSIRDVISFPKNQSGVDPVVDSPTSINEKILDQYLIQVKSS